MKNDKRKSTGHKLSATNDDKKKLNDLNEKTKHSTSIHREFELNIFLPLFLRKKFSKNTN